MVDRAKAQLTNASKMRTAVVVVPILGVALLLSVLLDNAAPTAVVAVVVMGYSVVMARRWAQEDKAARLAKWRAW